MSEPGTEAFVDQELHFAFRRTLIRRSVVTFAPFAGAAARLGRPRGGVAWDRRTTDHRGPAQALILVAAVLDPTLQLSKVPCDDQRGLRMLSRPALSIETFFCLRENVTIRMPILPISVAMRSGGFFGRRSTLICLTASIAS